MAKKTYEGFLIIDKPDGITSTDVSRKIKSVLKSKKIGYIGTLDPIATGVLVIALERATRLIPFLERNEKVYDAVLTLGRETDSQDRTGKTMREEDPSHITDDQVKDAMKNYRGEIEQIPPMFSAKKIDGTRLYELARQGISVERKPSKVTVHEMNFIEKNGPDIRFTARVSTGAYLRTLCHDIGNDLGVCGHLSALKRTSSGTFTIDKAMTLDKVERDNLDEVESAIMPLAEGLAHMPKAIVIHHASDRLKNGMALGVSDVIEFIGEDSANGLVRIVNKAGDLLGVGQMEGPGIAGFPFGQIKPKRVLV